MDDAETLKRVLKVLTPQLDPRGRKASSVRPYYNERWADRATQLARRAYDTAEPVCLPIGDGPVNKVTLKQRWYQGMQYARDNPETYTDIELLTRCVTCKYSGPSVVLVRIDADMAHILDWRGRCETFRNEAAVGEVLQLYALQLTANEMVELQYLFKPSHEFLPHITSDSIRVVRIG